MTGRGIELVQCIRLLITARCYAERGYTTVSRLSVCLSVRPSVRDVQVVMFLHTGWNTSKIVSRPNSLKYMLTLARTSAIWFNGNTPKIWWNKGGSGAQKTCNISETVQDRTKDTVTD